MKMNHLNVKSFKALLNDVHHKQYKSGVELKCKSLVEEKLLLWDGPMEEIDQEINKIMKEETKIHLKNYIFHYLQKHDINKMFMNTDKQKTNFKGENRMESCSNSNKSQSILPVGNGKGELLWYVWKAQDHWQQRVFRSVQSMSTELAVPLTKKRAEKEQREMLSKWNELSTNEFDLSKFRPVYAAKDFLEVVASLRNPNEQGWNEEQSTVFFTKVNLQSYSFLELKNYFNDLNLNFEQSGFDDIHSESFKQQRKKLGHEILSNSLSEKAQIFLRKGSPVSLRNQIWMLALGCEVNGEIYLEWERLKKSVLTHDLMVDSLIFKDVKLTATNDDKYFVFEDFLYQVLLCFSRDKSIHDALKYAYLYSYTNPELLKEKTKVNATPYPPSGVIPFHGFTMYCAPLCYVYDNPLSLYFVFREIYTRHFHHLHNISSSPHGIVALCVQFERLLLYREAQLFLHLRSLGLQPLKIAFKWMMKAFSGYLSCEQELILWDRIIGYNSNIILPLLSAAIFSFRKANLMQVSTSSSAENIMVDILTLEVIPLIQLFLFTDKNIN